MVRRLKSDLRRLGEAFPERKVEADPDRRPAGGCARARLSGAGSPPTASCASTRIATLPPQKAALAKLAFVGLQQRLLSSIAAFASHSEGAPQDSAATGRRRSTRTAFRLRLKHSSTAARRTKPTTSSWKTKAPKKALEADEEAAAEAASVVGAAGASAADLLHELAAVDDMLALASKAAPRARCARPLAGAMDQRRTMLSGAHVERSPADHLHRMGRYPRWLERRLREALADTDQVDERIAVFTGATGQDRREEVKRRSMPIRPRSPCASSSAPTRRAKGINLQTYCSDLVHFDLPWNPSRLEQRNGRIDRKLQPAKQVFCRYFRYEQREADIVLDALVRKTEVIREQLGSAGQVIEERITDRLAAGRH